MYRKLKRVWSHNGMNYIHGFREKFPELNKVTSEELCDRWADLGIDFYTVKEASVGKLTRITLPFALLLMLLMIFAMPLNFMITGHWAYPLGKKNTILNWFRSLRLLS